MFNPFKNIMDANRQGASLLGLFKNGGKVKLIKRRKANKKL